MNHNKERYEYDVPLIRNSEWVARRTVLLKKYSHKNNFVGRLRKRNCGVNA